MELGEAIKTMLKRRKVTQAGLVEKLGWKSQGSISSILSRGNMTVSTLTQIAAALGYELVLRCDDPDGDMVIGEKILADAPASKSELEKKLDDIHDLLLKMAHTQQAKKAETKIPLTVETEINGRYIDPAWYIQQE